MMALVASGLRDRVASVTLSCCDVSFAGVHGRLSWPAAIVTHLVTQDFLLLVQESEEIRHMRVMTASQASA